MAGNREKLSGVDPRVIDSSFIPACFRGDWALEDGLETFTRDLHGASLVR
jgi:hypothetical protein